MAIINFPDTTGEPTDGSFTYEFEGITYIWDGVKWTSQGSGGSGGGSPGIIPGNGTLTIKDSTGTSLGVFTANQSTNSNTDITLPSSSFSGNYNDLTNKPDIPDATSDLTNDSAFITAAEAPVQPSDIGDGTITINQGGSQKGTFTVNQTGPTIIDLDAGGGGGSPTVNLAWNPDGNNDAQILNSAGQDATVPIVRNTVAGLMTGDQKQTLEAIDGSYLSNIDLTYVNGNNKDAPGKVKANTGGSDATIPIATDSKAGLISGTLHQKLGGLDLSQYLVDNDNVSRLTNDVQYLRDGNRDNVSQLTNDANYVTNAVLGGITGQNPISYNSSNQIGLKYSKGLNLVSNNLEVDLGRGLIYNGNEIEADIPEQAVNSFSPIVVVDATIQNLNTKRGPQEATPQSGTFVMPDGASQFSLVFRGKAAMYCNVDGLVDDGGPVPTFWGKGIGFKIEFFDGVFNPNTGDNYDLAKLDGLAMPQKADRSQAGFCIRMNDLLVPGTGNRTINYSVTPVVEDSTGDASSIGVIGYIKYSSVNMLILPMTTTP